MKKWLLLLVVVLLIALLPNILSTVLGKPIFEKALRNQFRVEVSIDKLHLSWLGPQKLDGIVFTDAQLSGSIASFISDVPFWALSQMSKAFILENGEVSFPQGKLENIQAKVHGKNIQATGATSAGGSFTIHGQMHAQDDFDLTADLQKIPTIVLDKLSPSLEKILGPTFTLNGALTYKNKSGTLTCALASPNAHGSLKAAIADHVLTLQEPLIATLQIPNITQEPVIVRVMTDGFRCPFDPFSLKALHVESANLNLGKIRIQNSPQIRSLLKVFKNVNIGETVPVWLTPVSLKIENGVLEVGRIDALVADAIHLCAWGQMNVVKDTLDMRLGIPADTLEKFFGVGNLSKNYVLSMPVRGSLQEPELISAPAIAKLTAISVSDKLPIPGVGGKVFGGLVKAFAQSSEDEKAPPPNRPFPWEK